MTSGSAPLVSILIPCFNGAPVLRRCLDSVARQTHAHLEVIFVDNNSMDGSVDLVRHWAQTQPFRVEVLSCSEQGQAAARNVAFEHARGAYIQWLDCDDELLPDKIARQVARLEADPDAALAYGGWHWRFFSDEGATTTYSFRERPRADLVRVLLANDWRATHSHLLRHCVALDLRARGCWDRRVRYAADRHYFTTAALAGHRFVFVDGAEVIYNSWSDKQLTRSRSAALGALALSRAYDDFRAQVDQQGTVLSAEQHWLLHQPRALFRAVPGAECPAAPAAAAIAWRLLQPSTPASIETWSSRVVRAVWQQTRRSLGQRSAVERLARLRVELGCAVTPRPHDEADLLLLEQPGLPMVAPVLIEELLHVRRGLDAFIAAGGLRALPEPATDG